MRIAFYTEKYPFVRATEGSVGFDLYAHTGVTRTMQPGERWNFATGIHLEMPLGVEGQVRPRSGLKLHAGVVGMLGTIDSDFRGEVKVTLFNLGQQPYDVLSGDRIAQLVFAPVLIPGVDMLAVFSQLAEFSVVAVGNPEQLSKTTRGTNGFGSSGR